MPFDNTETDINSRKALDFARILRSEAKQNHSSSFSSSTLVQLAAILDTAVSQIRELEDASNQQTEQINSLTAERNKLAKSSSAQTEKIKGLESTIRSLNKQQKIAPLPQEDKSA